MELNEVYIIRFKRKPEDIYVIWSLDLCVRLLCSAFNSLGHKRCIVVVVFRCGYLCVLWRLATHMFSQCETAILPWCTVCLCKVQARPLRTIWGSNWKTLNHGNVCFNLGFNLDISRLHPQSFQSSLQPILLVLTFHFQFHVILL